MRQRSKNKLSTALLVLILLVLGIGYAYLSTTLSINGVTDVDRNVWDIYFDNIVVSNGSVTGSQVIDATEVVDDTTVSFHVNLKEPGEYYEFTVDAKNDGTIDAMINSISKKLNNVEITTLPTYLRYDVKYSDNMPIANNHLLAHESLETYKVRVEYRNDIDPTDLPSTAQSLTLSFGVEYVQADENAIAVPHPRSFSTDSWETIILAVQNDSTSKYRIGDTKTIELGNNLGTHTLRIANKSTPAICSTSGFSQTACGFVLEFADSIVKHDMNSDGKNLGGWPASSMREYLNNENDSESIISSLPEIIRDAIINTIVVTGRGTEASNFVSTDKLYLLAPHEIWEYNENPSFDYTYQDTAYYNTRQLDYYLSKNTDLDNYGYVTKKLNGSWYYWWLRTSLANSDGGFLRVHTIGGWYNGSAEFEMGVSPAFRLG